MKRLIVIAASVLLIAFITSLMFLTLGNQEKEDCVDAIAGADSLNGQYVEVINCNTD